MERERERVDGRRDDVRADARRDERVRERRSSGRLDVEPDRKAARLLQALDELLRDVREERAGRVVDEHARGAEVAESPRLLDERVGLAGAPRAVDEPDVELAARADDRLAGLAQVRDVVQRVVQPEDLDPVLGRARDEPAHDVGRDRLRADEEPPAERDPERRRRARVDRADPLPRALDPAPDGSVEDTAARDLEAAEAGAVEDLRDPQHLTGRHHARERLLREQPDRRVVELRHGGSLPPSAGRLRARTSSLELLASPVRRDSLVHAVWPLDPKSLDGGAPFFAKPPACRARSHFLVPAAECGCRPCRGSASMAVRRRRNTVDALGDDVEPQAVGRRRLEAAGHPR